MTLACQQLKIDDIYLRSNESRVHKGGRPKSSVEIHIYKIEVIDVEWEKGTMSTPPWSDMTTRDLDGSRKTAATLNTLSKWIKYSTD